MSSLPVPGSFGQLLSLSGKKYLYLIVKNDLYAKIKCILETKSECEAKEWLQLVPVFATVGLVGFISYKEVNDFLKRNQHAWVNKDYKKSNSKIVDMITRPEFNAALEKNEKVAYCRCWKSKKVGDLQTCKCVLYLHISKYHAATKNSHKQMK